MNERCKSIGDQNFMNIIIEGCDGAGKSTLAHQLSVSLCFKLQQGEGPGKSDEELNSRIERYADMENTIFDRHPCVSQIIYNKFREGALITLANYQHFMKQLDRSLVIYCTDADFDAQTFKVHDTPEHIELMRSNFKNLMKQYDLWAVRHAHIIYHKRMRYEAVLAMVQSYKEFANV